MDGPQESPTKWSKIEKESIIWYPLYVESKKKWYKWTCLQNWLTDLEKLAYGFQKGRDS